MDLRVPPASNEQHQKEQLQQQRVYGCAGGHEDRLTISSDGRLVLKKTTVEEAHFYLWLRRLSHGSANSTGAEEVYSNSGLPPLPVDTTWPLESFDHCPGLQLGISATRTEVPITDGDRHCAGQLLQWLPEVHGVLREEGEEKGKYPVTLMLENLLFGLRDPVVLDIKMGTRLYGDFASPAKIERATKYASMRGADKLGISFCGLWGQEKGNEFRWDGGSRLKAGGFRPTTTEAYAELFKAFLISAGDPIQISEQLLQLLEELRGVWKKQTIMNLYGSSLLIVAGTAATKRTVKLKMIDFAHPTFYPKQKDLGYLKGLDSLLDAVRQAAKTWSEGPGSGGCTELQALWQSRCQ